MRNVGGKWVVVFLSALAAGMVGCGPVPISGSSQSVAKSGPALAILPAENDAFPALVRALNDTLRSVHGVGMARQFVSKVSLEVVLLSIECIDAGPHCWAAAGKSLSADRMLFTQIEGLASKQKKRGVRVKVTLFDVARGEVLGEAYRSFGSEDEAVRDAKGLVDETMAVATPPPTIREAPVP